MTFCEALPKSRRSLSQQIDEKVLRHRPLQSLMSIHFSVFLFNKLSFGISINRILNKRKSEKAQLHVAVYQLGKR